MGAFLVLLLAYGCLKVSEYYQDSMERNRNAGPAPPPAAAVPDQSLPSHLEESLRRARAGGARAFKAWLDRHRLMVQQPRRTELELDYVESLALRDPPAAQREFAAIRRRAPGDPALQERIRRMARIYE